MDYGDKPAAAKWSRFTPPQWSLFCSAVDTRAIVKLTENRLFSAFLHEAKPLKFR